MMEHGQCVRIFTGAPLPIGADAVIMQEESIAKGALVAFAKRPVSGQNIRRKIDKPFRTESLRTVRGAGYRLVPSGR